MGAGLEDFENVYVLASGQSFYNQCCASASVDVAFSSTAMHWLSSAPCDIPDALHSACTQDTATKQAYQQQAGLDWAQILSARATELRPGGRLVIANFAVDDTGQFLGSSSRMKENMHEQFADIWRNLVTPEEFRSTNFPNQYRTLEEVK